MDEFSHTPGLAVTVDNDAVLIRVERDYVRPMLSILLHSKFSDGLRMDFLTSPHVNRIIEAVMKVASLSAEEMDVSQDMGQVFAPILKYIEDWARQLKLPADEVSSLLQRAIYPYRRI